jgi:FAD:protein FMN transferase
MTGKQVQGIMAVVFLAAVAIAMVFSGGDRYATFKDSPAGIMGTETELTGVSVTTRPGNAPEGVRDAEKALRAVEAKLSTYLESSELSRLNAAPAGEAVGLSGETLALFRLSKETADTSGGVFDPTFAPVFSLWRQYGKAEQLPPEAELDAARAASGWQHFEVTDSGATKLIDEARIDLGGIAKGYGIDRAAEAMVDAGCVGGLVNVGGDIRCFGPRADGGEWIIGVRHPFVTNGRMGVLILRDGAVCTSGNYERFSVIDGKRYSHIIDPRTGRPTEANPSVTVLAPSATIADAWATALSVLGPDGLDHLPINVDALVISGGPDDYWIRMTDGFADRFTAEGDFVSKAQDD